MVGIFFIAMMKVGYGVAANVGDVIESSRNFAALDECIADATVHGYSGSHSHREGVAGGALQASARAGDERLKDRSASVGLRSSRVPERSARRSRLGSPVVCQNPEEGAANAECGP